MTLQTRRLAYCLGAEIVGLDLRKPIDGEGSAYLRSAFLQHSVLLIRGQALTREQHVAYCRQFGTVDQNDSAPKQRITGYPELLTVTHDPAQPRKSYAGKAWHTDQPHTLVPPMATSLRGVEVPDIGGDTMFANMYLAYEALSDGMKKLIGGLHAVHPAFRLGVPSRRLDTSTPERMAETMRRNPPIAQPLVRTHPETGRKALYLTEKIPRLVGMTPEESQPLIRFLCAHATRPQFVLRHRWQKDDLLIWDNRCLMHQAANDFDQSQRRYMERALVKGTPSGQIYEGPQ